MVRYAWVVLAACGRLGFDTSPSASDAVGGSDTAGPPLDAALASYNRVFATSTSQPGNVGGLAGADAICTARAQSAGLPGRFVAFLSTTTVNAIDRIAGARGFIRTDGLPVADTLADLAAGKIFAAIDLDENGNSIGNTQTGTSAWTGSTPAGVYDMTRGDCSGWTATSGGGAFGSTLGGTNIWNAGGSALCTQTYHLYCFQIDHATPLQLARTGRLAFMSSPWAPGGGIQSADARCGADATAAALPGTYHALLARSGATAASRFDTTGARWIRVDGSPVFDPAAMLAAGVTPISAIDVTAAGAYGSPAVWGFTGASATNVAGTSNTTCSDWSSTTSSGLGDCGLPDSTGEPGIFVVANPCNYTAGPIYCLQD